MDLPAPSVYTPAPITGTSPPSAGSGAAASPPDEYEALEISAPAPDETIRSNEGKVTVSLRLEPTLRQGDVIELLLDGEKAGELRGSGGTLSNLDRGTHTLMVRVVDAAGQELISSEPVTFFLRRESKLFPQRTRVKPAPLTPAKKAPPPKPALGN